MKITIKHYKYCGILTWIEFFSAGYKKQIQFTKKVLFNLK